MGKLLLLLLMLGIFSLAFIQAQARICMTCNMFIKGRCVEDEGTCTTEEGGACITRDIYLSNVGGNTNRELASVFHYNHTILECSKPCEASKESYYHLKISSFCCKSQDFCNRYRGKIAKSYDN